jgi:F420H(2)-dependent quinone reductase
MRVRARETPVRAGQSHGTDAIVIASNYGGPKQPGWYFNLKAHPECELGGEKFLASEVTDPDDYARLYGFGGVCRWSDSLYGPGAAGFPYRQS